MSFMSDKGRDELSKNNETLDITAPVPKSGGFIHIQDIVGIELDGILEILGDLTDGILIVNELSNVVWCNPRFEIMTGYAMEEIQGQGLALFIPRDKIEKHARWVHNFRQRWKMMSRAPLFLPTKGNALIPVDINPGTLKGRTDDGEELLRMAIIRERKVSPEEKPFWAKNFLLGVEIVKKAGTPVMLTIIAFMVVLYILPRLLTIVDNYQRQNFLERQFEHK